jgi:hypothetical protein
MNFGMLFDVYLFAMTQTQSRQSAWFQSFVMWFLFDVFVSSTGVVLVTHLLIPLYVMSDIRTIKRKVLGDIKAFREKQKLKQVSTELSRQQDVDTRLTNTEFNSAKYLFTSWRVASLFPELPESGLILQFSTPWPKKSFKREKKKVTHTYQRKYSFIIQAVSRVLIFFVSGFLVKVPVGVQDLLIQLASNSGLGYVVLLMLQLYSISPLLPLAPILAFGIIVHFLILAQRNSELLEQHQELKETANPPLSLPTSPSLKSEVPPSAGHPESDSDSQQPQIEWEEKEDEESYFSGFEYEAAAAALESSSGQQLSNEDDSNHSSRWRRDSSLSSFHSIVWESDPSSEEF